MFPGMPTARARSVTVVAALFGLLSSTSVAASTPLVPPPGSPAAPGAPTKPGAPTGLKATANGSSEINLTWTAAAATGGIAIKSYTVERSRNNKDWSFKGTVDASQTSFSDTGGLTAGGTYYYKVKATNVNNQDGAWSASAHATTTGPGAPGAPWGLTATPQSSSVIEISWRRPSTGTSAIEQYEIEVAVNKGDWSFLAILDDASTTYDHGNLAEGTTYSYHVRAKNKSGWGPWSAEVSTETQIAGTPGAPRGLTANPTDSSTIVLTWIRPTSQGQSAITAYEIDVSADGGTNWSLWAVLPSTVTTFTHRGLNARTTRRYRVRARNTQGLGAPAYVTATTLSAAKPGAPRNLTADADGSTVIDLDWDRPSSNGGSAITGYAIEISDDGGDTWDPEASDHPDTYYRDPGLTPGTTYRYRVAAVNRQGQGPWSNEASATTTDVPGTPTGLRATARGTSSIELDWNAPSSGASAITGYRIEWSPTGTGRWDLVEETRSRATFYTDTDLEPGTTYYYRVAAIGRAGRRGAWSRVEKATTAATAPSAPRSLKATPGGPGGSTQIILTWTRPSTDGGSPITGYRIEWSRSGVSGWNVLVPNTRSTRTSYTDPNLAPGTTRYYQVAAINAKDQGPYSDPVVGTTRVAPPGTPQNLRARATGTTTIDLSWQAPSNDGGAAITGYRIRRRAGTGAWVTIRSNTNSTATTFEDTNLRPATGYRYQVAAVNSAGAGAWSFEAGTQTRAAVPGAPTALVARAAGTSRIDMSWGAPANTGGAPILGYRVEESSDGGRNWRPAIRNTNSKATTWSRTGLPPAATRHYRVAAINTAGAGPYSNVARATTDATVPGVPRNVSALANGTSQIDLSWQAPGSDGGAAIAGYRIEVSETGNAWSTLVADTRTSRTTYSHTGLKPASTRHYRVSAINRVGVSETSRVVNATTDATVPDAPTGFTATAVSPTQIDLAWVAPAYDGGAAITGYRIEVSETGAGWSDLTPNTGSTNTSYAHAGLLPGSTRHYRVSAINRAGAGEASGVAFAATDDPVERAGRVNATVLPHVGAAMASSTVGAIADRVAAVASGMGFERRMEMGGLSSMAAMLSSPVAGQSGPGRHGRSGGATPLLTGSSFQLPLGSGPQVQSGSPTQMAGWGAFEYHRLGEPGASALDWSGSLTSGHFGADVRVAADILAGVAASHSQGAFDFTDKTGASPVKGTYGTAMTSVNPYMAWFSGGRGNAVWATGGFGWGDVEVQDDREALRTSTARMMTGAAGGSYQIREIGTGGVRLKAEGWAGRVMVDGGERIDSVTLGMQRAKLAVEWSQGYRSSGGDEIGMRIEGGARYDNGDGINGMGAELGGGVRYANAGLGLTVEGRGRMLISAREGYEEWGVGGMLQLDPATRGSGLSVRLMPSYGDAASGVNELWDRGITDAVHEPGLQRRAHLDGEVAYGLPGFRGTPFGGFRLGATGTRAFTSGVRYDLGAGLGLRIEGTRREGAFGATEHTVGVRGRVQLR